LFNGLKLTFVLPEIVQELFWIQGNCGQQCCNMQLKIVTRVDLKCSYHKTTAGTNGRWNFGVSACVYYLDSVGFICLHMSKLIKLYTLNMWKPLPILYISVNMFVKKIAFAIENLRTILTNSKSVCIFIVIICLQVRIMVVVE
jgi:hypothetical protein